MNEEKNFKLGKIKSLAVAPIAAEGEPVEWKQIKNVGGAAQLASFEDEAASIEWERVRAHLAGLLAAVRMPTISSQAELVSHSHPWQRTQTREQRRRAKIRRKIAATSKRRNRQ